jgi:hypothetical protein
VPTLIIFNIFIQAKWHESQEEGKWAEEIPPIQIIYALIIKALILDIQNECGGWNNYLVIMEKSNNS